MHYPRMEMALERGDKATRYWTWPHRGQHSLPGVGTEIPEGPPAVFSPRRRLKAVITCGRGFGPMNVHLPQIGVVMLGRELASGITATVASCGWQLLWLRRIVLAGLLPAARSSAPCEAPQHGAALLGHHASHSPSQCGQRGSPFA